MGKSEWQWGFALYDNGLGEREKWYLSEKAFISKYRDVTLAIISEPRVYGFCYTQLYDVEGEVNGFMTYDRRWKVSPEEIRRINPASLNKHGE